jgi:sodium-dependent phosphate transporter
MGQTVRDYYEGHAQANEAGIVAIADSENSSTVYDSEKNRNTGPDAIIATGSDNGVTPADSPKLAVHAKPEDINAYDGVRAPQKPIVGPWYTPKNLGIRAYRGFFHGVDVDVVNAQKETSVLSGDLDAMHAMVARYDNRAEHTYSYLQVLTAATASFAHGANDVSNVGRRSYSVTSPLTIFRLLDLSLLFILSGPLPNSKARPLFLCGFSPSAEPAS